MTNIYNSIKSIITSDMIARASDTLGESSSKVASAVSILVPSLLGSVIKAGDTRQVSDIVHDAGRADLHSHISDFFSGSGIVDGRNYGERMENAIIGTRTKDFVSAVASHSGMAYESADRLTTWVSGTLAAVLGRHVISDDHSYAEVVESLRQESDGIKSHIPSNIYSTLGLSSIMGAYHNNNTYNNNNAMKNTNAPRACAANTTKGTTTNEPKKNGNGWLWWVILGLLLLVLLIFWWRSCDRKNDRLTHKNQYTNTNNNYRTSVVTTTNDAVRTADNDFRELSMRDGKKMKVRKGSCEDKMVAMLKDSDFKNMSDKDLKRSWIVMDNIEFKHNSADEFEAGHSAQLNNIVAILKDYPEAKIKIGGFADETGTRVENLEISEERAEFIKSKMVAAGINSNRIITEGFGEEFATVDEDATEAQRAKDRTIAMRFTK